MRAILTVIFMAAIGYALGFVLFVSNLPTAPETLPRADGIDQPGQGNARYRPILADPGFDQRVDLCI